MTSKDNFLRHKYSCFTALIITVFADSLVVSTSISNLFVNLSSLFWNFLPLSSDIMNTITSTLISAVCICVVASDPIPPFGYRLGPNATPAPPPATPQAGYRTETFATADLSKSENRDDAGQYSLSYITANGIRVNERGYLKASSEGYVPVKEGTYEYTSPDGTPVSISYKADENGYVVKEYSTPFETVPVPVPVLVPAAKA